MAYVDFLNHCYIDTENEMKEIYSSNHMWCLFEKSFLLDIETVCLRGGAKDGSLKSLENYVMNEMMNILSNFFSSQFSDQSTAMQKRQLIFVQLLQAAFRLSQCRWLTPPQRFNVENTIRTLSEVAKTRGIAIPSDLEASVVTMFTKSAMLFRQTSKWLLASKQTKLERAQSQPKLDRSIIEGLQDIVSLLEDQLKPLVEAEQSLLVDILYRSERLFPEGTESRRRCESGGFIRRLIKHAEKLLEEKEEKLCVEVLRTLREMMALDCEYGEKGDNLRNTLLKRYFMDDPEKHPEMELKKPLAAITHGPGAKYLSRAGCTLHEVQNMLDKEGASDLVVELVIKSVHSPSIFVEAVELGIALLEGGNPVIQKGMFTKFQASDLSQPFYKVFNDKMKDSQVEIKSTVTVNTTDIAAKANENKEYTKDLEKISR
jgi:inositol 1,4,5-triphosphate receptor type 1